MTPPDIVERLRQMEKYINPMFGPFRSLTLEAVNEIERLREEAETWRDRCEAERQDHEATMKAWDEERSGM